MGYVQPDRKAPRVSDPPGLKPPAGPPAPAAEAPERAGAARGAGAARAGGYGRPPATAELRGARLSHGLTIDQAAERFHIPSERIEAIERADLGALPEGAYRDGLIRAYVKQLQAERMFGHPPDWYLVELKREYAGTPQYRPPPAGGAMAAAPVRRRLPDGALRIAFLALAAVLAVTAGLGTWYAYRAVQLVEVVAPAAGGGAGAAG